MAPPGVIGPTTAPPLSIATPSKDTTMIYTTTKGLLNEPGQNNCFLNSAVQVLWHLDIFRRSFRELLGHACMAESCIFCALKELFSQLQFSNESALPPDALRKALAESFSDQQRFQLGFMDDAAECFENILLRIHMHIAHGESQDMCNALHCIPHQKFSMNLIEQTICGSCGATSEPLSYTQMVHYVSTSTLVYQVRNSGPAHRSSNISLPFGQLLHKAANMGDVRVCPSACGSVVQISRTLVNWPEIVSIGLVWNSERPSLEHIMEVFSTIGTSMLLSDLFNSVMDKRWTETCTHNLVGVVTYYGKHYSTFFFHTKLKIWIYFDDATVRQVGPHWDQVVEKCRKGRYQPLLLLYATPDGTPVNTDKAPKFVTQLNPQKSGLAKVSQTHSLLRRSVTPSPEKPMIGPMRRAITPNPDLSLTQKPPLPPLYNEYQNLTVIQNNLQKINVDGYMSRKEPEYISRKTLDFGQKAGTNIHRTLSNGSSSGIEGMSDNINTHRRRDSGNWSGDRNSASSASSTTMENPYLYLVGKMPHGNGNVPESPTLTKSDCSSAGSVIYDAGYDSYSLSSNDSSTMTTIQHMMKIGHLAKIPEDYNNSSTQISQSCDVLCDEADDLLVKSRQLEDEHDLVLALALCNAAATKARAAMNAPYNNPQTLTLARMKHNTCIMRARSLHRRMTQNQPIKENPPEIRHTREGSSGSGRHSRQNSRDKGNHSRQNSKELLVNTQEKSITHKNIEIYATLPKKKDAIKNRIESINIDPSFGFVPDTKVSIEKESRGLFSRNKQKDNAKREKRSRSEDRSKRTVEFSLIPEIKEIPSKETKQKEEKDDKKDKDGKTKKQHKIRRKLLMGGLIKRKNRSMPDLTDGNVEDEPPQVQPAPTNFADDSNLGLKGSITSNSSNISGYLSEGHLEFSGGSANAKLKKSKLMRKSFYASAGKILTVAKVPPPPPLRTTSQLSKSKLEKNDSDSRKHFSYLNTTNNSSIIEDQKSLNDSSLNESINTSFNSSKASDDTLIYSHTVVTKADVHQEQSPVSDVSKATQPAESYDEVDCMPSKAHLPILDLPPYPSPVSSAIHSRQASEEFPLPPPPLDLSALDEHLPQANASNSSTLLNQLQLKRQQILSSESIVKYNFDTPTSSGDTWLKELQAKQAALKVKRINSFNNKKDEGIDVVNTQKYTPSELNQKLTSVKDLTSKFECKNVEVPPETILKPPISSCKEVIYNSESIEFKRSENADLIAPEQIAEEIREVERINASLHETLHNKPGDDLKKKSKAGKKKSVSFCDQVILVATAEDQEDDSYIPNPILERVLRSAINKPEANAIRQEILHLKEAQEKTIVNVPQPPSRKNSVENLLEATNLQASQSNLKSENDLCNHYITEAISATNISNPVSSSLSTQQSVVTGKPPPHNNAPQSHDSKPQPAIYVDRISQNHIEKQKQQAIYGETQRPPPVSTENQRQQQPLYVEKQHQHVFNSDVQRQAYMDNQKQFLSHTMETQRVYYTETDRQTVNTDNQNQQYVELHRQSPFVEHQKPQTLYGETHKQPIYIERQQAIYVDAQRQQYLDHQRQSVQTPYNNPDNRIHHPHFDQSRPTRDEILQTQQYLPEHRQPNVHHPDYVRHSNNEDSHRATYPCSDVHCQQNMAEKEPPVFNYVNGSQDEPVRTNNQYHSSNQNNSMYSEYQQYDCYPNPTMQYNGKNFNHSPSHPIYQQPPHPNQVTNYYQMQQSSPNNCSNLPQYGGNYSPTYPPSQNFNSVQKDGMSNRQIPNNIKMNNPQHNRPLYQHPPSPVMHQNQRQIPRSQPNGIYQSVPISAKQNSSSNIYQRVPQPEANSNYNPYQRVPQRNNQDIDKKNCDVYSRVPPPHEREGYQYVPQPANYSNHQGQQQQYFRKNGYEENCDVSIAKAVVTPIIVNNANNSIPDKTKCNLCRKKIVASSNLYCVDCEYYMSRFKPKS